jgi:hypothetical protein
MAGKVHGKRLKWTINAVDLSAYGNATDPERTAETHETTTYGLDSKTYEGGLLDGTATLGGFYESGAASTPRVVFDAILGTKVAYVYMPEGVGTGKPTKTVDVVVKKYTESIPVGDMIKWSVDLQYSGPLVVTTQA